MLTSDSIEERVWETLRLKKSLFAGVFDSPTGEISFAKLGRKTGLEKMKEIFVDPPNRSFAPAAEKPRAAETTASVNSGGIEKAMAGLFEAGAKLFESLAKETSSGGIEHMLSGIFKRDTVTQRPTLSIPLPESLNQERLVRTISGLLSNLGRAASAGGK